MPQNVFRVYNYIESRPSAAICCLPDRTLKLYRILVQRGNKLWRRAPDFAESIELQSYIQKTSCGARTEDLGYRKSLLAPLPYSSLLKQNERKEAVGPHPL